MEDTFLEAIREIQEEKELDEQVVIKALESALVKAFRREHNIPEEYGIEINVDLAENELDALVEKEVVRKPFNEACQVDLETAEKYHDSVKFGERVDIPLETMSLSRSGLRMVKDLFNENIARGEQEQQYEKYRDRNLTLVNGVVQRFHEKTVYVRLDDKVEAILPYREQLDADDYRAGNRMKFLIVKVSLTSRGLLVVVSRTHPALIERLFELHIPEIHDGLVEVEDVAREAGRRSKVAVRAEDPTLDPIGTCVGPQGSRIQSIVNEASGEKIDIIPYDRDVSQFIINSLSPAQVTRVNLLEDENVAQVVVPKDQLSLAIGKGGQNARLTAKLSGWSIDIYSEQEFASLQSDEALEVAASIFKDSAIEEEADFFEELEGVGSGLASSMQEAGLNDPADLIEAGVEGLQEVEGIGAKKAEKIYEQAREYVQSVATQEPSVEESEEETAERIKESIFGPDGDDETEEENIIDEDNLEKVETDLNEEDVTVRSPFREVD